MRIKNKKREKGRKCNAEVGTKGEGEDAFLYPYIIGIDSVV